MDTDKMILKFMQKDKRPQVANTILKNDKVREHYPTSKLIIATIINIA